MALMVLRDSIPWGNWVKMALQAASSALSAWQAFSLSPVPSLGAGETDDWVYIAFVLWNAGPASAASDLNVSPWGGSWPTLPRHWASSFKLQREGFAGNH